MLMLVATGTITMILLIVAFVLLLALLVLTYFSICKKFYREVFYRPQPMPAVDRSPANIDQSTVYGKGKNWFYSHRMEFQNVSIEAFDKVHLAGYYRRSFDMNSKFVVILLHGYNEHPAEMSAYARLLMKQIQCHVLIPHLRAHHMSGGKMCTYGLYESVDLMKWIEFCKVQAGDDCRIFILGRSMGATTALLAAQQKEFSPNVAGIIADCPMESLENVALDIFRRRYKFDGRIFYNQIRKTALTKRGFDINMCDCAIHADRIRVPVLIFQGGEDHITEPASTKRIYDNIRSAKRMVVVDHADHLMSYDKSPATYERETRKFIEECVVLLVRKGRM